MHKANENIIYWFELLIGQLKILAEKKTGKEKIIYGYKLDSITKALNIISNIDYEIKNGEALKDLKYIGKGTIQRINEIIKTGKLAEVDNAMISGKYLKYIEQLEQVFGIGHTKAHELYIDYGITSIDELKLAFDSKKIKLPNNIAKGLKYIDKIEGNIKREEIDEIYDRLLEYGIQIDPNMDIRICGSYRREKMLMNDIDVMISHPNIITLEDTKKSSLMKRFIKLLFRKKLMVDNLTSLNVPTKFMGLCQIRNNPIRRIDIRFIPQESYYTALLYFTGSKEFNRTMRTIAIDFGYTLNEYHLLNQNGIPFIVKSEKDIFNLLNMEYIPPTKR